MRYTLVLVGMLAVIGSAGDSQDREIDDQQGLQVLTVSGMSCSACAATVEAVAKKIEGVKSAVADQPKGVAEITYDPAKTTPTAIAKRISETTSFKAVVQKEKEKEK